MIENIMPWIWLGIFVVAVIVEAVTEDLVSIWFCGGSLVSLILSFIPKVPWWVEVIVFVVISAGLLLATRPLVKRLFAKNTRATNIDSYVGKHGLLIKEITTLDFGEVKINGIVWTAMAEKNKKVAANSIVEVIAVDGNKLVIRLLEDQQADL
jgi:membrane protein implicated in regulation of membrane protease activity